MSAWWDDDRRLLLLTPDELAMLPDGTEIEAIDGDKAVVGSGAVIDADIREGHTAWGVTGDHPLRLAYLERFPEP